MVSEVESWKKSSGEGTFGMRFMLKQTSSSGRSDKRTSGLFSETLNGLFSRCASGQNPTQKQRGREAEIKSTFQSSSFSSVWTKRAMATPPNHDSVRTALTSK